MTKHLLLVTSLLLILCTLTYAIYLNDFLINSGAQKEHDWFPFVLADSEGNFYVFWTKYCYDPTGIGSYTCGRAYLKKYNSTGSPITSEIPLTPDSMKVLDPIAVALSPSGFILAWTDYSKWLPPVYPLHIYFQRFDSNASPLGEIIRVDNNPLDSQAFVKEIEVDTNGNFVIVWKEALGNRIFARKFLPDGNPVTPIFNPAICLSVECTSPRDPKVTMHPDGHFLIVWNDNVVEYNTGLPLCRLYDTTGVPVWPEARILTCDDSEFVPHCGGNQSTCLTGNYSDADMDSSGNFMMVTGACDGEPFNNNVYGRLFDEAANELTHNFKINTANPKTYDLYPRVFKNPGGGYFAIWSECRYSYNEGPRDIFIQRHDSLSNPIGPNWRINTPRGSARNAWTAFGMASTGDKVFVVWGDYRNWATYPSLYDTILIDIYGQLVDIELVGSYLAGDVNFDGGITLADVIWLANYVLKGTSPPDPELWLGDVNANCRITLADVIYLVNYIFKGGPPPQTGCAK